MSPANGSPPLPNPQLVRIVRFVELADRERRLPEIEAIFFESATKKSFASPAEREAFRERWLTRYLAWFPDEAFVALTSPAPAAVGYLIGCLNSASMSADFADIGYGASLHPAVAEIVARYPAHLHINVRSDVRGLGVGQRLIDAFIGHALLRNVEGAHVVTGAQSRAVGFYRKCGFEPITGAPWPAPGTLALGRRFE